MTSPFSPALPRGALETRDVVFPAQANHRGTLFAGHALASMARVAWLAARDAAGRDVVMAGVTGVQFLAPVAVGQVLTLRAWVSRVGRSSLTVCVRGVADVPAAGLEDVLQGVFEMVAVDAHGRPTPIDLASVPAQPETTAP